MTEACFNIFIPMKNILRTMLILILIYHNLGRTKHFTFRIVTQILYFSENQQNRSEK